MLRSIVSRAIMPNFEKDLARSLTKEVQGMDDIMGSMIAPQVFSYQGQRSTGAFTASSARSAPVKLVRVARQAKNEGLFHE